MLIAQDKDSSIIIKIHQTFFKNFYHYLPEICWVNLKNKITKIEHKKIFSFLSKIFKNISWPINICLKYFITPTKLSGLPSYILNVRSRKRYFNLEMKRPVKSFLYMFKFYFNWKRLYLKANLIKSVIRSALFSN